MRLCEACNGRGWTDDLGAEMPCEQCKVPGQIAGSGWVTEAGEPAPADPSPGYIESFVPQTCHHCGYRNVLHDLSEVWVFRCRGCGRVVEPNVLV